MSSNNLAGTTQTISKLIFNCIKEDKELKKILRNEEQISYTAPNNQDKSAQLSIFLYNIVESAAMRNQPQVPKQPRTLLYLDMHYLITPLTRNPETDQMFLGRIMQLFAEKPVLRGVDLQGSLKNSGSDLRIALDSLSLEDQNKLWTMLASPYKPSVSYRVSTIEIKSETKKAPVIKKPQLTSKLVKKEKSA